MPKKNQNSKRVILRFITKKNDYHRINSKINVNFNKSKILNFPKNHEFNLNFYLEISDFKNNRNFKFIFHIKNF